MAVRLVPRHMSYRRGSGGTGSGSARTISEFRLVRRNKVRIAPRYPGVPGENVHGGSRKWFPVQHQRSRYVSNRADRNLDDVRGYRRKTVNATRSRATATTSGSGVTDRNMDSLCALPQLDLPVDHMFSRRRFCCGLRWPVYPRGLARGRRITDSGDYWPQGANYSQCIRMSKGWNPSPLRTAAPGFATEDDAGDRRAVPGTVPYQEKQVRACHEREQSGCGIHA
jgi:hypothetical protein